MLVVNMLTRMLLDMVLVLLLLVLLDLSLSPRNEWNWIHA